MACLKRAVFGLTSRVFARSKQQHQFSKYFVRGYSEQSFLQNLLRISKSVVNPETHSKELTASNVVYEFQFDDVQPQCMEDYLKGTSAINKKLHEDEAYPGELVVSLQTLYGSQDQAVHIWKYAGGYQGITEQMDYYKNNKDLREFNRQKNEWCYSRTNQLCQDFSYFNSQVIPRQPEHIYELRTYALKPGTLIEWGNRWSTTNSMPRKDVVAAFYSQVGYLYMVHHLWTYIDMEHRSEIRDNMWQIPGWDECVAATVPLVRHMQNRILVPISD